MYLLGVRYRFDDSHFRQAATSLVEDPGRLGSFNS